MRINLKLHILLGLFVGLLVGMNLLGCKVTTLFKVSVSVGIFIAPLTFLITDIVEEVYGRKVTQHFVWAGVITIILLFLYTALFIQLEPNPRYPHNEEYKLIFGSTLRMMVASLVAFFLGQMHDIWAFNFWRKKSKGKFLWLRNNASTIVSQLIDTTVFMFIAFYQLAPKFTVVFVIHMIIPYYLFKLAFAFIDTPFVYLGVKWLRKGMNPEEIAELKSEISKK